MFSYLNSFGIMWISSFRKSFEWQHKSVYFSNPYLGGEIPAPALTFKDQLRRHFRDAYRKSHRLDDVPNPIKKIDK